MLFDINPEDIFMYIEDYVVHTLYVSMYMYISLLILYMYCMYVFAETLLTHTIHEPTCERKYILYPI